MNKPMILLISAKAQHGKDTFATEFTKEAKNEMGFRVLTIKYGDILKYVCKEYFGWNGEKDETGRRFITETRNRIRKKK